MADKHPHAMRVPVQGGSRYITVRPLSMAQLSEVRPALVEIFREMMSPRSSEDPAETRLDRIALVSLVERFEPQVQEVVRGVVPMPDGLEWDDLDYEDFLALTQAVWLTSIVRPDGGGLLGKLIALAGIYTKVRGSVSTAASEARSDETGNGGGGASAADSRSSTAETATPTPESPEMH